MVSDVDGDGGGGLTSLKVLPKDPSKNVEHPNGCFFRKQKSWQPILEFPKIGTPNGYPKMDGL